MKERERKKRHPPCLLFVPCTPNSCRLHTLPSFWFSYNKEDFEDSDVRAISKSPSLSISPTLSAAVLGVPMLNVGFTFSKVWPPGGGEREREREREREKGRE